MTENPMAFIVPIQNGGSESPIKIKPGDTLIVKDSYGVPNNYDLSTGKESEPIEVSLFYTNTTSDNQPYNQFQIGAAVATAVQQIMAQLEIAQLQSRREASIRGIKEAKARGVKVGRRPLNMPEESGEIIEQYKKEEISCSKAARELGVSRATVRRWAGEI